VWYALRYAKAGLLRQRHALAKPPGGNGFVLAGVVAVTAPSWRVSCGAVSSVTPEVGFLRAGAVSGNVSNLTYDAENRLTTVSGATSAASFTMATATASTPC